MHVQWLVSLGVPSRVCVLSTRAEFTRSINVNLTKRSQRRENPKLLQPATPQLTAIANRIMPPKASTDFPAPCMLQPSYQQGEASARRPIFVASPALATYVLWLACEYVRGIFENHFLPTTIEKRRCMRRAIRCDESCFVGGWPDAMMVRWLAARYLADAVALMPNQFLLVASSPSPHNDAILTTAK